MDIEYTAWSVIVKEARLNTSNKVRNWLLKTPQRRVHQLYNPETCRVHYLYRMRYNGQRSKFVHLPWGNVLIVKNLVAACTSTVHRLYNPEICRVHYLDRLKCESLSGKVTCTPTTRWDTDCWKPCSGLYINCTTLKLVVWITYTEWSVIIQAASLYTYNKERYWLLKTRWWPVYQLYNSETCRVHYLFRKKCDSPSG